MPFPPQFGTAVSVYQRPTILLVEDDSATREMFDYALRPSGFALLTRHDDADHEPQRTRTNAG